MFLLKMKKASLNPSSVKLAPVFAMTNKGSPLVCSTILLSEAAEQEWRDKRWVNPSPLLSLDTVEAL